MFFLSILLATAFVVAILGINIKAISQFLKKMDAREIKIDEQNRQVIIGDSYYRFSDIIGVSVIEDAEQLSTLERCFSRTNCSNYYASILFDLKNGSKVSYNTVKKTQIYKILKKLKPYVKLQDNPDYYKVSFFDIDAGSAFGIALIIIVVAVRLLIYLINNHH